LLSDPAAYKAEKGRILAETIRALGGPFPGIEMRVEASDVATPTSCERYTGNWRGSTQGWLMTAERMKKMIAGEKLPKTFAGLGRFYLIGQWSEPGGGLPPCARNGRDVVRAIMKAEGRKAAR
jgi:phytoene dehydrogenase-like protein